jgi:hypothetical protein
MILHQEVWGMLPSVLTKVSPLLSSSLSWVLASVEDLLPPVTASLWLFWLVDFSSFSEHQDPSETFLNFF